MLEQERKRALWRDSFPPTIYCVTSKGIRPDHINDNKTLLIEYYASDIAVISHMGLERGQSDMMLLQYT